MNRNRDRARPVTFLRAAVALAVLSAVPALADTPYPIGWKAQVGTLYPDLAYDACVSGANAYVASSTDGTIVAPAAGRRDVVLLKYTTAGAVVWSQQFGTSQLDEGCGGVGVDALGNVYASGSTMGSLGGTNTGNFDGWVAQFNSAGAVQWTAQFGNGFQSFAYGMAVDPAGNSYVAGSTYGAFAGTNAGGSDAFVVKYNNAGVQQWRKQLGSAQDEFAEHACTDPSGNVVITGYTSGGLGGTTNAGGTDAFLAKYDSGGNPLWVKQLGTNAGDYGWNVASDTSGNVYMTGITAGALGDQGNVGGDDAFVAKYNSAGVLQWVRQLGTSGLDRGYAVTVDAHGHIFLAGPTGGNLGGSNAGNWDTFVAAFDDSGRQLWVTQFGTVADEYPSALATDAAGNIFTTGQTGGSLGGVFQGGINDIFVAELAAPAPEPATLALLGFGVLGCLGRRRRATR